MIRKLAASVACAITLVPGFAQTTAQQPPQQQPQARLSLEDVRAQARAAAAQNFNQQPELSKQAEALTNSAQSAEDFRQALFLMQRKAAQGN